MEKQKVLSIFDGLLIIGCTYLLTNGLQWLLLKPLLAVAALLPGGDTGFNRLLLSQLLQTVVMIGLVGFFLLVLRKRPFADIGLVPFRQLRWLPLALLSGVLLYIMSMLLTGILAMLFPQLAQPQMISNVIVDAQTPWEIAVVLLTVGVLAPVSEEMLFRGYIYHSVARFYPKSVSVLVTSLWFGCMHYDLLRLLPLTMVGLFLNIVLLKSGSLYGAMLMHSTWNVIMVLTLLLF